MLPQGEEPKASGKGVLGIWEKQARGYEHLILLSWWVDGDLPLGDLDMGMKSRKRLRLSEVRRARPGPEGLRSVGTLGGHHSPSSLIGHWSMAALCQTAVSLHEAPGNRKGVDNNSM